MSSNALAIIEIQNPHEVFTEKGLDPIINKIRAEVKAVALDISTDSGRKEIASLARKVASSKVLLDDMGKKLTEGLKKQTGAVDAERKRMRDELDKLRDEVRQPLTEWEEKEAARVAEHEAAISEIERASALTMLPESSECIAARISHVDGFRVRDWQEFAERAQATIDISLADLNRKLVAAKEQEAQKAELERLRQAEAERLQKERDEKLKEEAASKAKADAAAEVAAAEERARKAEADRIAAEDKAKADAIEAAAKAQRDADAAVQRERDRAESEKRAEAEATAKREADKSHKAKINNEALVEILAVIEAHIGCDPEIHKPETLGKTIISAIVTGAIPHIKITY